MDGRFIKLHLDQFLPQLPEDFQCLPALRKLHEATKKSEDNVYSEILRCFYPDPELQDKEREVAFIVAYHQEFNEESKKALEGFYTEVADNVIENPRFKCPIQKTLMICPVISNNNNNATSYEYEILEKCLEHSDRDPITKRTVAMYTITPDYALRQEIEEYCSKQLHTQLIFAEQTKKQKFTWQEVILRTELKAINLFAQIELPLDEQIFNGIKNINVYRFKTSSECKRLMETILLPLSKSFVERLKAKSLKESDPIFTLLLIQFNNVQHIQFVEDCEAFNKLYENIIELYKCITDNYRRDLSTRDLCDPMRYGDFCGNFRKAVQMKLSGAIEEVQALLKEHDELRPQFSDLFVKSNTEKNKRSRSEDFYSKIEQPNDLFFKKINSGSEKYMLAERDQQIQYMADPKSELSFEHH